MKLDELCHPDAHQLTMTTKQMAGKSKMMMKKKMKKNSEKSINFIARSIALLMCA